jgi:hypothetical protein
MNDVSKLVPYIVRVTRVDASVLGGNLSLFYAVLTDAPERALRLIEEEIPPTDTAELPNASLSAETARSIGLRPHIPQLL